MRVIVAVADRVEDGEALLTDMDDEESRDLDPCDTDRLVVAVDEKSGVGDTLPLTDPIVFVGTDDSVPVVV